MKLIKIIITALILILAIPILYYLASVYIPDLITKTSLKRHIISSNQLITVIEEKQFVTGGSSIIYPSKSRYPEINVVYKLNPQFTQEEAYKEIQTYYTVDEWADAKVEVDQYFPFTAYLDQQDHIVKITIFPFLNDQDETFLVQFTREFLFKK